ncbi:MAG: RNA-binding S4 domain-containing protein [Bacteroidota bacterium]|nr:RNA-binding S4 domain-containing protein [Bacteroidota bacterium]
MSEEIRFDKFLWAVRIYKTRTLAAEACAKGQVTVDGVPVKPSRHVKEGEVLMVRKSPVLYTYKVLKVLHTRLSAEKVKEYIEDTTPVEEFNKIEMARLVKSGIRDRGTGRPTKRDRRDIDKLQGNS